MVLQGKWESVWPGLVRRALVMAGGAGEFDVVLGENAVVKNSDVSRAYEFSGSVKARAVPDESL